MKFIHLSDLHLGKSVNEFSLIKDQEYILQEILEVIEKESVDAVLIAGDIYDRAVPSEEAVRLFDEFLTTLSKRKKKVFIISGNHDSDSWLRRCRPPSFGDQKPTGRESCSRAPA